MKELSDDFLDSLIKEKPKEIPMVVTWVFPKGGPIAHVDRELRCKNTLMNGKVCRKPTHFFLYNEPTCMLCCVRLMNQRLIDENTD